MSKSGAVASRDLRAVAAQSAEHAAQQRQQEIGIRFECHQRAVNATTTLIIGEGDESDQVVQAEPEAQMEYAQTLYAWVTKGDSDDADAG